MKGLDLLARSLKRVLKPALIAGAACAGFAMLAGPAGAADKDEKQVDFAKEIKPIFAKSCVRCHKVDPKNPRSPAAGLSLEDKASAMKGGKSGKAIVEGKSADSLLYKLLSGPVEVGNKKVSPMPKPKMGEKFKPLEKEQIELIKKWIDQGAKWED